MKNDLERILREARRGDCEALKELSRTMKRTGKNHALDITHGLLSLQGDFSEVEEEVANITCEQVVKLTGGKSCRVEIPTYWYVDSVTPSGGQVSVRVRDLREHKNLDPIFISNTTTFEMNIRYTGNSQKDDRIEAFYALLLNSSSSVDKCESVRITFKVAIP